MGLLDYVRCHQDHALFVRADPKFKGVQEEVELLKAMRPRRRESVQPMGPLLAWDAFLKPQYSDLSAVRHPDLCFWVRDTTHHRFGEQWGRVLEVLLERGLWRDQIVSDWAMQNATAQVDFFDPWDNLTARCGGSPGSAPRSSLAPRWQLAADSHQRPASPGHGGVATPQVCTCGWSVWPGTVKEAVAHNPLLVCPAADLSVCCYATRRSILIFLACHCIAMPCAVSHHCSKSSNRGVSQQDATRAPARTAAASAAIGLRRRRRALRSSRRRPWPKQGSGWLHPARARPPKCVLSPCGPRPFCGLSGRRT